MTDHEDMGFGMYRDLPERRKEEDAVRSRRYAQAHGYVPHLMPQVTGYTNQAPHAAPAIVPSSTVLLGAQPAAQAVAPTSPDIRALAASVLATLNDAIYPREDIDLDAVGLICKIIVGGHVGGAAAPAVAPPAQAVAPTDEALARVAHKGYDDYWAEDSPGRETEAWAASAKAVLATFAAPVPAEPVLPLCKVAAISHRWDSAAQQHIPTLVIEFEPVPANSPNTAKGWADRDRLAAMLAAAPASPKG